MKRNLKWIIGGVALILLIPLVGDILRIYFGIGGWNWTLTDFLAMGAILFITGLAIDFALRTIKKPIYRRSTVIGIILVLLCVWIQLATGGVVRFLIATFGA